MLRLFNRSSRKKCRLATLLPGVALAACCAAGALAQPLVLPGAQPVSGGLVPASAAARPIADERPLVNHQIQVQDVARVEGQGTTILRGIGIVTGLRGTGDSGSEEVISRPLREIYKQNELPLPDLRSLAKAKSAAMVFLECVVSPAGAHRDDELTLYVTVSHTASSLVGGRLHLAALSGPFPGQGVYAMGSGEITIENPQVPTAGVIRRGAKLLEDIRMPAVGDGFTLILQPQYRRFATAQAVASVINSVAASDIFELERSRGQVAFAVDHSSIRVTIPVPERVETTRFVARVLAATLSPELLQPPAVVRINQRSGTIVAAANIEITPAAIANRDLQIQSISPEPVPTPQSPRVSVSKWTSVATTGKASDRAKLQDLLALFRQTDVPIDAQIAILVELHQAGRLHAELIYE